MILPITDLKKALLSFLHPQILSDKEGDVLVHFAYNIDEANLTFLIDTILAENKKVFYFNRPEENLNFLAFGETFFVKIKGINKFSVLGDRISVISKNLISNLDDNSLNKIPLFLGGTKFSSGMDSPEWKDFASNDWFIPRFLFYKKGNDNWIVINFIIDNSYSIKTIGKKITCILEPICGLKDKEVILPIKKVGIRYSPDLKEKMEWNDLVSDALSKIEGGLFRKVVISRRLSAGIKTYPLFNDVLKQLQENYNNCSIFLYASENSILFGATPEQLLKLRKNEVEFDALAGSAKRGDTEEDDKVVAEYLLNDKKNIEEHNHVIEFIKSASSKYVSNFRQFNTGIKKFSNIQHIYTPIKAELNSREQIYKLVEDIFPTPAICGLPKHKSFNYINENEKFDRGLFSGIIGFITPGEMDLVVAIRSALLNENKLYIYAGCGIVKGSDPSSEFEETEIKMRPILSLFNNEN